MLNRKGKKMKVTNNAALPGGIYHGDGVPITNGLIGTHLATGYPVTIHLNYKEMQLAMDKGPLQNDSWELMNASVLSRGEMNIIGDIDIDSIVIGGVAKVFH